VAKANARNTEHFAETGKGTGAGNGAVMGETINPSRCNHNHIAGFLFTASSFILM
jgi:hypothetical protein